MTQFARHKRATFDYEILKTYEAGLVLHGHEVKAIRSGKLKLEGSHVIIRGNEAFWTGAGISPYQPINTPDDYETDRVRTLLLSKKEIHEIEQQTEEKGLTCIPIACYNKSGKIKLEIAVVRGKKKTDKRESIKKRDSKRDIDRTLKNL